VSKRAIKVSAIDLIISFQEKTTTFGSTQTISLVGFPLDGSCPPINVEERRFSDVLDRPLEITGTC